jgi:RNA methyltransferase, TrmH family
MITSIQNPRIQQVRRLLQDTKERKSSGLFVIEGIRLMEEALQSGLEPLCLIFAQNINPRGTQIIASTRKKEVEILEASPDLLQRISDTEQPQGILGVFPILSRPEPSSLNFVVILDSIRDPGNLGTILRTCTAAGVQTVWLAPGCADPYSPKVLRAGMGAHFHLPLQFKTWEEIASSVKSSRLHLYLAESGGGISLWQVDLTLPIGLVICNEAEGPSREARSVISDLIHIPMPGQFESLNASVAAAILLFETVRQRNQA